MATTPDVVQWRALARMSGLSLRTRSVFIFIVAKLILLNYTYC